MVKERQFAAVVAAETGHRCFSKEASSVFQVLFNGALGGQQRKERGEGKTRIAGEKTRQYTE